MKDPELVGTVWPELLRRTRRHNEAVQPPGRQGPGAIVIDRRIALAAPAGTTGLELIAEQQAWNMAHSSDPARVPQGPHLGQPPALPRIVVILLGMLGLAGAMWLLRQLSWLVAPVFLALNMVIVVYPLQELLRRRGLPKALAVALTGLVLPLVMQAEAVASVTGKTAPDEVVRRLAGMPCAADDFRIFWDNAYSIHHLGDDAAQQDQLLDIRRACDDAGNPDRCFKFASTSKVTFPGAGISAMAASSANIADMKAHMSSQIIGHDKLNQLRHVKFLHDGKGLAEHMAKHAAILRPKFELVDRKLSEGLSEIGGCTWSKPRVGYFVSFNAPAGCAKRIVKLAKDAGVTMTGAGATWPYKQDPIDSNIRIAPSLPPVEELDAALDVFVCCVKLAYAEKLLQD